MNVLELGNYIVPAYAGMILAEQGNIVRKWINGRDPILGLDRGDELWAWINYGKTLESRDLSGLPCSDALGWADIVIDNLRYETMSRHNLDPCALAEEFGLRWVSLRADTDNHAGRSFDVVAQARSWMEYGPWMPFYLGDTASGLWLAFKALNEYVVHRPRHVVIYQATCLQKLVEGELIVDVMRDGRSIPWDRDDYYANATGAHVAYKGASIDEPVRDRAWKLANLRHVSGRMTI